MPRINDIAPRSAGYFAQASENIYAEFAREMEYMMIGETSPADPKRAERVNKISHLLAKTTGTMMLEIGSYVRDNWSGEMGQAVLTEAIALLSGVNQMMDTLSMICSDGGIMIDEINNGPDPEAA